MTQDAIPQWSDEAVADAFRAELRERFEVHNAAYRANEVVELARVLAERPEMQVVPGFEVRDSFAWEVYQACEIKVVGNIATIVMPIGFGFRTDLLPLFDHTKMAWARPIIGAMVVDGEARPTIEILLVATWTDEMDAKWCAERNDRKQVVVELYEDDVRKILGVIAVYDDKFGQDVDGIRKRLEMALEPIP